MAERKGSADQGNIQTEAETNALIAWLRSKLKTKERDVLDSVVLGDETKVRFANDVGVTKQAINGTINHIKATLKRVVTKEDFHH